MFEPEQPPLPYRLVGVDELVDEFFDGRNKGTVQDYFRKDVLHVYELGGATNKKKLTEENSARIRIAVCDHLRRHGRTIADSGQALRAACGDDDKLISELIADERALDEIYEIVKDAVLNNR